MAKHLDRVLVRETPLPFRIHDATKQRFLLYYIYKHKLSAMRSAYWIVRWMDVGTVLEVIDARTMALIGWCKHHADGQVTFHNASSMNAGLHLKHTRS